MPAHDLLTPDLAATILDSIAEGVFTVDRDWKVSFFNRAAEQITGISREEAVGRLCCEVFRADICESGCALREISDTGRPVMERTVSILSSDGRQLPISISAALLKDEHGAIIGGVETFRDLSVVEQLRKELTERYTFHDIVSRSHSMQNVLSVLPELGASEATVLITGESGTGKELIARALHSLSPRAGGPFVGVNCGALPETLLESELFGHVSGAFTGASRSREGRFAQARHGTLFLDEIGDVSPALQVRLLRVLQEREYEPVGASRPVATDVRVLCATNRDIDALVREGSFREDLYYRINVVRVRVPALRERTEDISLLAEHFVAAHNRRRGRSVAGIAPSAMVRLVTHDWPGNVRELENAIEHACILAHGDRLELADLPEHLRCAGQGEPSSGLTLAELETRAIEEALRRNEGRRLETARELGIHKTTLWRRMKRLGIDDAEES